MKTEKISLSGKEKIGLISNIATMLGAGIPILETIDSLLEDSKGNQKKLLEGMREDLMQGQHISYTFSRFPRIFDKVTVSIVHASEEAGTLDVTLKDLKDNLKRDMEFSDKIRSALIYPGFIMCLFFAILLMMLIVVIPKIATVFIQLKVALPLPTQIMIFMSDAVLKHTIPVILGLIIVVAAAVMIYRYEKKMIFSIFTSLPIISKLSREIDLTRFCRSLFLLLSAGIPITTALELSAEVVSKKDVIQAIAHAKDVVSSGKKFSEALKEHKDVFPPIIIKIIEAGEKSGGLDSAMRDAAEYLDYEVGNSLKAVTALIEPLMLVVVGGLVGGMMLAIIAPIYGMISQISPQHS